MLHITPQHRLKIAVSPLDFRKGIDSLVAFCRNELKQEPFDGCLFAFCNRRKTSIKLICYDGNGFLLCQKRFSRGKLQWWPQNETQANKLRGVELLIILQQGHPEHAHIPEHWRQLPTEIV
jgi:transposase